MILTTLLLCFLKFANSQTCTNTADLTPGQLSFGVRVLDTFLEFQSVSLLTCVKQCMRRLECKSFNYCEKMNYCELNYKIKNHGVMDYRTLKSLYVQSDISSWDKHLHLIGNCKGKECGPMHHCNTSGLCELSDCGQQPILHIPNAVVIWQGDHRIGNGVFVGCQEPTVMKDSSGTILPGEILPVKCNDFGDWEIPSFTFQEDMLMYDNHWYYFSTQTISWWDAQNFCRSMNSHLVQIDNKQEFEWIHSEIRTRDQWFWTGGNDMKQEGSWVWEGENSKISWQNWHKGQPDNYDGEDCIVLLPEWIGWGDFPCQSLQRFICEQ